MGELLETDCYFSPACSNVFRGYKHCLQITLRFTYMLTKIDVRKHRWLNRLGPYQIGWFLLLDNSPNVSGQLNHLMIPVI